MTRDSVTPPQPTRPADRYGPAHRPAPRWAMPLLLTLVALAGLVVAVVGYRNHGHREISGHLVAFSIRADEVRVTFVVARDHPNRPATCLLRARSEDGAEVATAEVPVPPGDDQTEASHVLVTTTRATTAEVRGCRYTG